LSFYSFLQDGTLMKSVTVFISEAAVQENTCTPFLYESLE
jgi:hypothetical protein